MDRLHRWSEALDRGAFDELVVEWATIGAIESISTGESYLLGVALVQTARESEAIAHLQRAAESPRSQHWSLIWLARAYERLEQYVEAAANYRQAAKLVRDEEAVDGVLRCIVAALSFDASELVDRRRLAEIISDEWRDRKSRAEFVRLQQGVEELNHSLAETRIDLRLIEERLRDQDGMVPRSQWPPAPFLWTDHQVAHNSADHIAPHGTAVDNSRHPRFVWACERIFDRKVDALDLGCSGGGLVRDFLIRGHMAMGLEGSDYSLKAQRAEWRNLEGWLRTCDITKPFQIESTGGSRAKFDVICAWEVLEHLHREDLPKFFNNVREHLAPDGLFVASVALTEDVDPVTGAVWHVTLEPREWWEGQMANCGLKTIDSPFEVADYVRGAGTVRFDWDVRKNPEMGFHVVAQLA